MENYQNYKKLYDWRKPKNRKWPDQEITKAPIWCSVDLRDGNQALANPMTLEEKIEFFDYLVSIGFKEIEIGFPAASETEFQFTRFLIENNKIPDDVKIQVLTQSREEIIARTFEALEGAKNAIVHLYNSTSKIQREVVFHKNKEEVKKIATDGARLMNEYIKKYPNTNWYFEYSPESFSTTELDYATQVINAVLKEWKGHIKTKPIINLPATIECSMPNVFADQVEYICENVTDRENVIISIHSHNDRGCGVATSEMSLLAGADRIEGALFGNGERTGNADIMNIAMNMYVLGVDPELDFSHINESKAIYEKCTKMKVGPRHPYAGELVFTAFSGSHQDAISKGLKAIEEEKKEYWEVPYLPLNPKDVNRQYEPIIRINSQSGKGGVAFIIKQEIGYKIPKEMQKEIGYFIKDVSDRAHRELNNQEIIDAFLKNYQNQSDSIKIVNYQKEKDAVKVSVQIKEKIVEINSNKADMIDSFLTTLKENGYSIEIEDCIEQVIDKMTITYVHIKEKNSWAVGMDKDKIKSKLLGIISVINRMEKDKYDEN